MGVGENKKEGLTWRIMRLYLTLLNAIWQFALPILVVISHRDVFGFLFQLGQEIENLERNYYLITGLGYSMAAINGGFLIWHHFVKRKKNSALDNKIYFWWLWFGNMAIIYLASELLYGPIHGGGCGINCGR